MKRTLALLATLLSVGLVRAMETPTEQKKTEKDGAGSLNRWGLLRTALPELIQRVDTAVRSRETQEPSRPGDDEHKRSRSRSRSPRNRVQQEQTVFMSKMWTELESILPAGVKDTFKEFMVPDFLKKAQEDPNVLENLFQKFDEISQDPALQEAFDKFFDTPAFQQFMAAVIGQRMEAAMAEAMQFALAAIPQMVVNSAPGTMHPVLGGLDQVGDPHQAGDPDQAVLNEPVVFQFGILPGFCPLAFMGSPFVSLPEHIAALETKKYDGNLFKALDLHDSVFANEEALDKVASVQDVARDEDAEAVFKYLVERDNAKRYHQLMDQEGKMKLSQQEQPVASKIQEPQQEQPVASKIQGVHKSATQDAEMQHTEQAQSQ